MCQSVNKIGRNHPFQIAHLQTSPSEQRTNGTDQRQGDRWHNGIRALVSVVIIILDLLLVLFLSLDELLTLVLH